MREKESFNPDADLARYVKQRTSPSRDVDDELVEKNDIDLSKENRGRINHLFGSVSNAAAPFLNELSRKYKDYREANFRESFGIGDTVKRLLESEDSISSFIKNDSDDSMVKNLLILADYSLWGVSTPNSEDIKKLFVRLVRNNLPYLENLNEANDKSSLVDNLRSYFKQLNGSKSESRPIDNLKVMVYAYSVGRSIEDDSCKGYIEDIDKSLLANLDSVHSLLDGQDIDSLSEIFMSDSDENSIYQFREMSEKILPLYEEEYRSADGHLKYSLFREIIRMEQACSLPEAKQLIDKEIASWGLPVDDIREVWSYTSSEKSYYENNLLTMLRLEEKQRGVVATLAKKYGIVNFGRYPEEVLFKQYEAINKNDKPYGIIIYPYADHNKAFQQPNSFIGQLSGQLGEDYYLRIVEAGSKQQIARDLINFDRSYGDQHKISFAIIGGHGTEDSIQFGGNIEDIAADRRGDESKFLLIDDLSGKGVQRTGSFFVDSPSIILQSCSTGASNGIGQRLAKELNANVIAPKIPTNIGKVMVFKGSGRDISFDVEYNNQDTDIKAYYNAGGETKS